MIPASLTAAWASDLSDARPAGPPARAGQEWALQRRCALTPAQLMRCLSVLVAATLAVGTGFLWAGVPFVSAFAGLELLAVLVAFWVHVRHAADGERLVLVGDRLLLERRRGGHTDAVELSLGSLRLARRADGVIELRQGTRLWTVGEMAMPARRAQVLDELKAARAKVCALPGR